MNKIIAIREAFIRGDLEAVRALVDNPSDFPNSLPPLGLGTYWLEEARRVGSKKAIKALEKL